MTGTGIGEIAREVDDLKVRVEAAEKVVALLAPVGSKLIAVTQAQGEQLEQLIQIGGNGALVRVAVAAESIADSLGRIADALDGIGEEGAVSDLIAAIQAIK